MLSPTTLHNNKKKSTTITKEKENWQKNVEYASLFLVFVLILLLISDLLSCFEFFRRICKHILSY